MVLRALAADPDRRAITTAYGAELTAGDFAAATYRLAHELLTLPAVARCAVYGVRDAQEAEHVHVAVVPAPGHEPQLEDISAFVTADKGRVYVPEAPHLVCEIPLTDVGKPDKKRLCEALAD